MDITCRKVRVVPVFNYRPSPDKALKCDVGNEVSDHDPLAGMGSLMPRIFNYTPNRRAQVSMRVRIGGIGSIAINHHESMVISAFNSAIQISES